MEENHNLNNNKIESAAKLDTEFRETSNEKLPRIGVNSKKPEDILGSPLLHIANQRNMSRSRRSEVNIYGRYWKKLSRILKNEPFCLKLGKWLCEHSFILI